MDEINIIDGVEFPMEFKTHSKFKDEFFTIKGFEYKRSFRGNYPYWYIKSKGMQRASPEFWLSVDIVYFEKRYLRTKKLERIIK